MKLNRKGYMLVEIIISFSIAMAIAMFLLNLTIKFKNTSEDLYHSTLYLSDKIAITKNIMNDLDNTMVENYESCPGNCILLKSAEETKKIEVIQEASGATTIKYGKVDNTNKYQVDDVSYYEKQINNALMVGNISLQIENGNYFIIKIPVNSLYDKNDYDILIMSQRNPKKHIITFDYNYLPNNILKNQNDILTYQFSPQRYNIGTVEYITGDPHAPTVGNTIKLTRKYTPALQVGRNNNLNSDLTDDVPRVSIIHKENIINANIAIEKNQTYTYMVFTKANSDITIDEFGYNTETKDKIDVKTTWQRIVKTFTAGTTTTALSFKMKNENWGLPNPNYPATETSPIIENGIYISDLQLAKGIIPTETVAKEKGESLGTLPTPTREGFDFDGWYTDPIEGDKIDETTTSSEDTTYYAHWKLNKVTVTYDINYLPHNLASYDCNADHYILPNNNVTATFNCVNFPTNNAIDNALRVLVTDRKQSVEVGGSTIPNLRNTEVDTINEDSWYILEATMRREVPGTDAKARSYTIEVNHSQQSSTGTWQINYLTNDWNKIYVVFKARDAENLSWHGISVGSTEWQKADGINNYNKLFLANLGIQEITKPETYRDSLVDAIKEEEVVGDTIKKLPPAPTRPGYKFNGWYTRPASGTQISSETIVPNYNVIYYAHWTKN